MRACRVEGVAVTDSFRHSGRASVSTLTTLPLAAHRTQRASSPHRAVVRDHVRPSRHVNPMSCRSDARPGGARISPYAPSASGTAICSAASSRRPESLGPCRIGSPGRAPPGASVPPSARPSPAWLPPGPAADDEIVRVLGDLSAGRGRASFSPVPYVALIRCGVAVLNRIAP